MLAPFSRKNQPTFLLPVVYGEKCGSNKPYDIL
jgi:hypothetical protein